MAPEILYGIGTLILLGILVWAVYRARLKSPRAKAISEEATREEYKDPENYDKARQDELGARADAAEARKRS